MNISIHNMIYGALLSASMIIAIGAQNLFIIKNGIIKNHILLISTICFLCDVVLMATGIFGLGTFFQQSKILTLLLAITGSLFLLYYAYSSFKSAIRLKNGMDIEALYQKENHKKVILKTLYVTLLNPHVYIDTVLIIGGVGATLSFSGKYSFLLGSILVSFIWFFSLGYGARLASQFFRKKTSLMMLDLLTACIMLMISLGLLKFAYTTLLH